MWGEGRSVSAVSLVVAVEREVDRYLPWLRGSSLDETEGREYSELISGFPTRTPSPVASLASTRASRLAKQPFLLTPNIKKKSQTKKIIPIPLLSSHCKTITPKCTEFLPLKAESS
jgi:hypothetical protein